MEDEFLMKEISHLMTKVRLETPSDKIVKEAFISLHKRGHQEELTEIIKLIDESIEEVEMALGNSYDEGYRDALANLKEILMRRGR